VGKKRKNRGRDNLRKFGPNITKLLASEKGGAGLGEGRRAPLALLPYPKELSVKNSALQNFWKFHELPGAPDEITASPKPRAYRTTSKRKAHYIRGLCRLIFDGDEPRKCKDRVALSSLEPPEHDAIYTLAGDLLNQKFAKGVAAHLNYLIIRGSYRSRVVIFNMDRLNGPIVRTLKIIARKLNEAGDLVHGALIYLDPSRSSYYLESKRPEGKVSLKRLFGPAKLSVTHAGRRYLYDPTSFSQVNESMVEPMLQQARALLEPDPAEHLVDLYCGYGLFCHFLAADYQKSLGVDAEGPSIRSAIAISQHRRDKRRPRFLAAHITAKSIEETLPPPQAREAVILDPPRQGPLPGVIAQIALRRPAKVLHVFCNVDLIPACVKEWQLSGYRLQHAAPLDMFPGTLNLEVILLFVDNKLTFPSKNQ